MNITYRIDNDILYLAIEGRVDASNATAAEKGIAEIRSAHKDKHTVIDADRLEYISSAGLRVILKIRKEEPKLAIINVSPEVFEVFDMTGFTEMVTIEKAFRRVSIDGCEFIAKGANGAVYRYDDETIVKTYFAKDALPEIRQERENARRAFVLGINTAIPYDIVRVGDGYGSVTELLSATSISKLIRRDAQDLTQPIRYFVDMLRSIHETEVAAGEFPDMKATAMDWVAFLKPHLPAEQFEKLHALVAAVPESCRLLHGDYHTNNVLIQNDEAVLIDMDTLCMGHPVFEFASVFNAFIGFGEHDPALTMDFLGYSHEVAKRCWLLTLKMYFNTEDEAFCRSIEQKAQVIGYTRLLRRSIRRPEEAESRMRIELCKKRLAELLPVVDSLDFDI